MSIKVDHGYRSVDFIQGPEDRENYGMISAKSDNPGDRRLVVRFKGDNKYEALT